MKRSLKLLSIILICVLFVSFVPNVSAATVKGDLDGDGEITTKDARVALRFASSIEKPSFAQITSGDMNGDGTVTIADVKSILLSAVDVLPFEEQMVKAGFPISYAEYLAELHEKHPEWEFEPFITKLDWQASIDGERTPHSQQLIENSVNASFKCACTSCNGIVMEKPNWVSASEEAVKYYMDPRNFLTEEYIFQFESTAYNSTQTIEGIEAILDGTWMHNSYITYLDGNGTEKTYTQSGNKVKYSTAILKAAKDSGMSAYYLASKIVQEVGSSSASNAGGASGKNTPYNGIYNYYNIGANTGVADGLRWANGKMKTAKITVMYKTASTSSDKVATISSGSDIYYIATSGSFYKVSAVISSKTYTGFVPKENISLDTSYGRPWDNPYKTIYYGAKYIYEGFSEYQFTGYLQKFNVNPESGSLYDHEYMANVRAAASEAKHTYNAYVDAGIIKTKKVFSIPVFKNMPNADLTREEAFKQSKPAVSCSAYSTSYLTFSWSAIPKAENYQVYKYDTAQSKYVKVNTTAGTSYSDTSVKSGEIAKYKVRAYYKNDDGTVIYSSFSSVFNGTVAPANPTGLSLVSKSESAVKIKWSATANADRYVVYRYDAISGAYKNIATVTTNSYTDNTVSSGTAYKYKIRSGIGTGSKNFYSGYSSAISVTTLGEAATKSGTVKITDGYLNLRSSASTSSSVVTTLSDGQAVTILGTSGDWYKVTAIVNGTTYTGYAKSEYITVGAAVTPAKEECPYTEPTATVRQGDSGESVKWVQWHLYKLGYLEKNDIDGDFGPTTLAAVISFQEDSNLDADGLVGALSRAAMIEAYK